MFKTILKELVITVLLFIAVILILAVIFYDYNPINKVVPSKVAYTREDSVSNLIQENVTELDETSVVYNIDGADLTNYRKTNSYVSGKANPFATTNSIPTDTNSVNYNNQTGSQNTVGNENQNVNKTGGNSTQTFYNNVGKK